MYDVIIIGAGPAGLTASIYLRRNKKKVLLIDALGYGGQIINTKRIDNYPATPGIDGFTFATNIYNQAKDLGAEFAMETVTNIINKDDYKEVITKDNTYKAKAIIIATGAKNRHLNLPNEKDLIGKGISFCATCDGNFYKDMDVAVVGGGRVAIDDAIYLSNICNKVYLIHRNDTLKADKEEIDTLRSKDNVEIILNSNIKELIANNNLEAIKLDNNKELKVNGLFIAIGQVPNNDIFKDLIDLDKYGYIKSDENCTTNIKGIFVAGDARTKELRQLVTATSDGAIAATKCINYLNN